MPSVADELRRSLRERIAGLSADERLAMTEHLAYADLEFFCAGQGLGPEQARRLLMQRRQAGRLPSRVMRRESP